MRTRGGAGAAEATVAFRNGATRQRLRMALDCGPAGWRIADIAAPDMPSLMALAAPARAGATPGAERQETRISNLETCRLTDRKAWLMSFRIGKRG